MKTLLYIHKYYNILCYKGTDIVYSILTLCIVYPTHIIIVKAISLLSMPNAYTKSQYINYTIRKLSYYAF